MSILGIIAEFNPLHRGHVHLITELKAILSPKLIICAMSGNFTQRGEPALCNKWLRAQMAVQAGIDLVVEIPYAFAVRSAAYFANGGVSLLNELGCTHLGFGAEMLDLSAWQDLAQWLEKEPETFQKVLTDELKTGKNFAEARWIAIQQSGLFPTLTPAPNTILAIEYIRAIRANNAQLQPCPILRCGESYLSEKLSEIPSATGLRTALASKVSWDKIAAGLPDSTAQLLYQAIQDGIAPIFPDNFGQLMLYRLRTSNLAELKTMAQIGEGIENRLYSVGEQAGTWQELLEHLNTKRYPRTRLQRMLLAILFDISRTAENRFDAAGLGYISVLSTNSNGQSWLKRYRQQSLWPVLGRGRDVRNLLNCASVQSEILALDIKASDIYSLMYPNPSRRKGSEDFRAKRY